MIAVTVPDLFNKPHSLDGIDIKYIMSSEQKDGKASVTPPNSKVKPASR